MTCRGGIYGKRTEGWLITPRHGNDHWLPRFAIFVPDRGKPRLGVITDKDVIAAPADGSLAPVRKGTWKRLTTCTTETYTDSKGRQSQIRFEIRFKLSR